MSTLRCHRLNSYQPVNLAGFGARSVSSGTLKTLKERDTSRYKLLLEDFGGQLTTNDVLLISEDARVKVSSSVATLDTGHARRPHAGASVTQDSAIILVTKANIGLKCPQTPIDTMQKLPDHKMVYETQADLIFRKSYGQAGGNPCEVGSLLAKQASQQRQGLKLHEQSEVCLPSTSQHAMNWAFTIGMKSGGLKASC